MVRKLLSQECLRRGAFCAHGVIMLQILDSVNHTDCSVLSRVRSPQTSQVGGTVGAEPWRPPCLGRGQWRVALAGLW